MFPLCAVCSCVDEDEALTLMMKKNSRLVCSLVIGVREGLRGRMMRESMEESL